MKEELIATIVPSLLSIGISAIVSLFISNRAFRNERKMKLDQELREIIEISVEYPYLENKYFIEKCSPELMRTDEKYMRYDLYWSSSGSVSRY